MRCGGRCLVGADLLAIPTGKEANIGLARPDGLTFQSIADQEQLH
jgi:hypothetical protein